MHSGLPRGSSPATRNVEHACLYAGVFFAPFPSFRVDFAFFTLSDAFFCCALFLGMIRSSLISSPLGMFTFIWNAAFTLVVAGLLMSSLLVGDPVRGMILVVQYGVCFIALPFVLMRGDERESYRLLSFFVAGVAVLDLHGIVTFFTIGYVPGSIAVSGAGRLTSLIGDANATGCVNAFAIVMVVWLHRTGWLTGFRALILVLITVTALVLTSSNTGLIATTAGVSIFFTGSLRIRQLVAALGLAAVAGTALLLGGFEFLPAAFQKRVLSPLAAGEVTGVGTFSFRAELMRETIQMINEKEVIFVGVGADQFRELSTHGAPVHNAFLILWVEGGMLSLLGWLLLLSVGPIIWFVARHRKVDPLGRVAVAAMFVTFAAAASATTHMYARYWFTVLLLTLQPTILALCRERQVFGSTDQRTRYRLDSAVT